MDRPIHYAARCRWFSAQYINCTLLRFVFSPYRLIMWLVLLSLVSYIFDVGPKIKNNCYKFVCKHDLPILYTFFTLSKYYQPSYLIE